MLVKVKAKNLVTGQVLAKTLRGSDQVSTAYCEKRTIQFLFQQDDEYTFMDLETYDQFALSVEMLGERAGFLTDGLELHSLLYNGKVVTIELPTTVELRIVETTPALKGATAQAQPKPATLETGITVQVPGYLTSDVTIRVDTRDARFVERVKG